MSPHLPAPLHDWWRGGRPPLETLYAVMLASAYALYGFLLLLLLHQGTPMNERLEWRLFIEGWIAAPAIAAVLLVVALGRSGADDRLARLATLTFANACVVAGVAVGLRQGSGAGPGPLLVWGPLAANAAALWALPRLQVPRGIGSRLCPPTWGLLAVAVFALSVPEPPTPARLLAIAAGALVLGLARVSGRPMLGRWARRGLDGAVLCGVAWLLFDPHLHFEPEHHGWYLGPANHVLQGGAMLVDVVCAYGVLPVHAIAAFFALAPFPLSFVGFSLFGSAVLIAEYLAVYAVLRHLRLPVLQAALAMVGVTIANFIALNATPPVYPSLGPLRYGLPWLLPLLVALRARQPSWEKSSQRAESFVVAASSLWSLETCFFTVAAYAGVVAIETAADARRAPGWWARCWQRLAWTAGSTLGLQAGFAALTFLQSGSWPSWRMYLALISAYTPGGRGIGLAAIPAIGTWVAMTAIYATSLFGCVLALPLVRSRAGAAALACIGSVTLMGVAQFSIYVGKSAPERIYPAALPVVVVLAFWAERLSRRARRATSTRLVVACTAYAALLLCLEQLSPRALEWWHHDTETWLGSRRIASNLHGCAAFPECLWDPPAASRAAERLEGLIERFDPGDGPIGVFLSSPATTEVLIRSGRPHVFPLNKPFQDGLVLANAARIALAPHALEAGDVIFVRALLRKERRPSENLLRVLLHRVCDEEFVCRRIMMHAGVEVMRLEARSGPAPEPS